MTENYKKMLEKGLKYQDFVAEKLLEAIGMPLCIYSSKEYQLKGENIQGIEIKFDDRRDETGNWFIEIAEKSHPDNPNFVDSGIYRNDNTWLYLIGNYKELCVFDKKRLQELCGSKKYRELEIGFGTSRGYLLPAEDANKYCAKKLNFK